MTIELTQKEIDLIYYSVKQYVKNKNNVDYLDELTENQQHDWIKELDLIKKFSKL